jgi:thymidylate synthase
MPPMPTGDPWPSISSLLRVEAAIRSGAEPNISDLRLNPYWADLAILLQVYAHSKNGRTAAIAQLKKQMSSDVYEPYIRKKQSKR